MKKTPCCVCKDTMLCRFFSCAAFAQLVQVLVRLVTLSVVSFIALPLPSNSQTKDSRLSHFPTQSKTKEEKMRQDVQKQKMAALTDDCRLLVISHMPLAYAMAWRMKDYGVSLEDLRQEGCLGLCEAAMRYDESADCSFAAYASHWCRKMMLAAINRYKSTDNTPPEAPLLEEQEDADLLRTGQRHRIDDALKCLTQNEQQVIRQFYGLDTERRSLTEIARSWVSTNPGPQPSMSAPSASSKRPSANDLSRITSRPDSNIDTNRAARHHRTALFAFLHTALCDILQKSTYFLLFTFHFSLFIRIFATEKRF